MQIIEPLSPPMHPTRPSREVCWREVMQVAFDGALPGEQTVESLLDRLGKTS